MPTAFDEKVWQLLRKIPSGKVTTYKQIAIALGNKNAARAVANACNRNPNAPKVACHMVVKSDGSIGGYVKGVRKKIALLQSEGIVIKNNKVLELSKLLFEF